jgi:hypothetical protein
MLVYQGKNDVGETLSWRTRVRIVLESAQGMIHLKDVYGFQVEYIFSSYFH